MMLPFYIGSYTEYPVPGFGGIGHGIYTVQLNTDTGEITTLHTKKIRNPSYLTISKNKRFLYCSTELDASDLPMVKAYRINDDLSLEFINEQRIGGGFPCHIAIHENNVLIACYASGNVIQYPLDLKGSIGEAKAVYYHKGSSSNKSRQEAPHAHQIAVHPQKKDVYVCDLGIDTIKAYHLQQSKLEPNEKKDCTVSKGGGPRHLVFSQNGNFAYVLNELSGNVSVLYKIEDNFKELNIYKALPDNYKGEPSGSAIRLHPTGQFLYVANRKIEAITIFRIAGEKLELIDFQYTNGEELREFNLTPDGKWLIACHQNSHDTVVYKIQKDGRLVEKFRTKEMLSPVCIAFLN